MIRYYFFFVFYVFFVLYSFGQKEAPTVSPVSNSNDKVTSMDPSVFVVNGFSYKRVEEKKDNHALRLGIKSQKLFVVDSLGNAQPYVIDNFDCSVSVKGGGIAIYSCVGNSITDEILAMIAQSDIGSKIFFDSVVVRDRDRKSFKDIIKPLVVQRIK